MVPRRQQVAPQSLAQELERLPNDVPHRRRVDPRPRADFVDTHATAEPHGDHPLAVIRQHPEQPCKIGYWTGVFGQTFKLNQYPKSGLLSEFRVAASAVIAGFNIQEIAVFRRFLYCFRLTLLPFTVTIISSKSGKEIDP